MALEQLPLLLLDEPGLVRVNEGWGRIAFVPRVAWEFLWPILRRSHPFNSISLSHFEMWVPRPCVYCKGGYHALHHLLLFSGSRQ
jgi:hypothetical protein